MRIALIGKKNAGKDALADALCKVRAFRRLAFADPMKEMLNAGLGIPREVLWGDASVKERADPRFGVTVRHMLQTLGTEWGRGHIHQDLWVMLALSYVRQKQARDPDLSWVCTDVRFLNEARLMKEDGFTLVRITRPGSSTGVSENHQSETEQDEIECDLEVQNTGPLSDLDIVARAIVEGNIPV